MDSHQQLTNIKCLAVRGMFDAIAAHKYIFKNDKVDISLAYLNSANAKFSAAEALYYACQDSCNDATIDRVFNLFYLFSKELLENVSKNHSHQWTDERFLKLREAFMASPFAFEDEELFS